MKPEAQRLAIAEACGRKPNSYYCGHCRECVPRDSVTSGGYHEKCMGQIEPDIPNYLTDLNAMHEAEKELDDAQYHAFTLQLNDIAWRNYPAPTADAHYKQRLRGFASATAPQRAEAFLKTLNLWTD